MNIENLTPSRRAGLAHATDKHNATMPDDAEPLTEQAYLDLQVAALCDDYERQRIAARAEDEENKALYLAVVSLPDDLKSEAKAAVKAIVDKA